MKRTKRIEDILDAIQMELPIRRGQQAHIAKKLGISLNTLRYCLTVLEHEGVVESPAWGSWYDVD